MPQRHGHYSDALARARQEVVALIAEVFGGLSQPAHPPAPRPRQLARVAAKHTTRDSTKYTRCVRSFRQYHGQRISHAIVMTDARPQHPRGDPEAQEDRCCCSAARPTRAAPMWRPSPAWGVDCLYQFTSYMREGYTRHAVRTNLTEAVRRIKHDAVRGGAALEERRSE